MYGVVIIDMYMVIATLSYCMISDNMAEHYQIALNHETQPSSISHCPVSGEQIRPICSLAISPQMRVGPS